MSAPAPSGGPRTWLETPRGDLFAFLWGFAEATFFFFLPDVFLTASAARNPRRGLRHVGLATAGALIGGLTLFLAATLWPGPATRLVDAVPFVTEPIFERARASLESHGPWAMAIGAFTGLPYKVFAVLAPGQMDLWTFALVTVPARAARFLVSWLVASLVGRWIRRRTTHPGRWIMVTVLVAWITIYAIYWTNVARADAAHHARQSVAEAPPHHIQARPATLTSLPTPALEPAR